jgi:outer membrane protein assembly factor BamA
MCRHVISPMLILACFALAALFPWSAAAADWPVIREITFSGNKVTQDVTMRRELLVQVGGPADPGLIERSRQAVQDLGLFRSVAVERSELPGGGVRLNFTVREKWYILPVPRLQANSDGSYGYGGELRWNNLWGLNHTLQLQMQRTKDNNNVDLANQLSYQGSYSAPYVFDSHYSLAGGFSHTNQISLTPQGQSYNEDLDSGQVVASYALSALNPSHGWSVGGGLAWQRDATSGEFALPGQGQATSVLDYVSYNDLRYLIYSEEGQVFNVGVQEAIQGLASDYYYSNWQAYYRHDWHIGSTPHQTVQLIASSAAYFGGGPNRIHDGYAVGGSRLLRGYPSQAEQGDFYYYISGAYLRPLYWNWLRLLVVGEAGSAQTTVRSGGNPIYASIGVGLRLRFTFLVNVEVEGGLAFPLVDGSGARLFAGPVN